MTKRMPPLRKLLPFLLALGLMGCTTVASINNPISTPTLAAVESSYGAALSVAVGYRDACAQRLIPSSCRPIVAQLQTYGRQAQGAVVAARNFVRNNPTIDPVSAVLAAQAAVSDFKEAQTRLGVN